MITFLDKAIAIVSPSWGLSRAKNRTAFKAYEAAKPSRTHKPKGDNSSGDSQVDKAGRSLAWQARFLEENSDLVDGLLTTLVNNVVGKNGISVEPMPLTYAGEVHQEFAKQLSDFYAEWSLKPDTTGEFSRPELERLAARSWLRDGECFGEQILGNVAGFTHPNGEVPFSIQALESDFIPMDSKPKDNIYQGIQCNEWQQPINYLAYLVHPGDSYSFNTKTRSIPAYKMMHLRLVKRLHQKRGITILASSLKRLGGLDNYEESELVAARIAAAMAFYIRKGEASDFDIEDANGNKRRSLPISPGTVFDDLKPGEDVGTIESKRPNALMQKFRDTMVRMVCAATGANFSTVSKQYDGTYSAQRQELVESYLSYGVMSNAFIARWCRPTYRRAVEMAIISGRLVVPPEVDIRTVLLAYYQAPVMPWIDPHKEAKGHEAIVSGGFGTEAEVIRSRGNNPREVKRQRDIEIKENREKKLVYSSDAYHKFYANITQEKE